MNIKQYPKIEGLTKVGFSFDEIERGEHTLWMDVECPHCGKEQSLAQTGYVGGPCCRCGIRTDQQPDRSEQTINMKRRNLSNDT